jgi:hypothetical protein
LSNVSHFSNLTGDWKFNNHRNDASTIRHFREFFYFSKFYFWSKYIVQFVYFLSKHLSMKSLLYFKKVDISDGYIVEQKFSLNFKEDIFNNTVKFEVKLLIPANIQSSITCPFPLGCEQVFIFKSLPFSL